MEAEPETSIVMEPNDKQSRTPEREARSSDHNTPLPEGAQVQVEDPGGQLAQQPLEPSGVKDIAVEEENPDQRLAQQQSSGAHDAPVSPSQDEAVGQQLAKQDTGSAQDIAVPSEDPDTQLTQQQSSDAQHLPVQDEDLDQQLTQKPLEPSDPQNLPVPSGDPDQEFAQQLAREQTSHAQDLPVQDENQSRLLAQQPLEPSSPQKLPIHDEDLDQLLAQPRTSGAQDTPVTPVTPVQKENLGQQLAQQHTIGTQDPIVQDEDLDQQPVQKPIERKDIQRLSNQNVDPDQQPPQETISDPGELPSSRRPSLGLQAGQANPFQSPAEIYRQAAASSSQNRAPKHIQPPFMEVEPQIGPPNPFDRGIAAARAATARLQAQMLPPAPPLTPRPPQQPSRGDCGQLQPAPGPMTPTYACEKCDKPCSGLMGLLNHKREMHVGRRCFWHGCSRTTGLEFEMYNHLTDHCRLSATRTSARTYNCPWRGCTRGGFTPFAALTKHVRTHNSICAEDAAEA